MASDSWLPEYLKKAALPAFVTFVFAAIALLLEQIYLVPFDLDLTILGSQFDTTRTLVQNSGYLVGFIPITALAIAALLFLVFTKLAALCPGSAPMRQFRLNG